MARVAVELVVVAAVGLVHHDDDIPPVGELRVVGTSVLLGLAPGELLQGREVDATGDPLAELLAKLLTAGHGLGLVRKQHAHLERVEELLVELGAVGDHHDGGVQQFGLPRDPGGVELHLHGLARALGVPDDAGLAVALDREHSAGHSLGDSEVLVRLRDALRQPSSALVERNEVPLQLQETLLVRDPEQQHLQRRRVLAVNLLVEAHGAAVVVDVPR